MEAALAPTAPRDPGSAAVTTTRPRRRLLHAATVVVLVVGVLLTGALAVAAWSVHDDNEDRLLRQRTREAASVLTAALPGIQTPLASAAVLAEATDADPVAFDRLVKPLVGDGEQFVSASLWTVGPTGPELLHVVGAPPALESASREVQEQFLLGSTQTSELGVVGLLGPGAGRLGYSFTVTTPPVRFIAYAEIPLPANRRSPVAPDSPFSVLDNADSPFTGLDNAVYLGRREDPASLLTSSTDDLPMSGRRARETVAFGDRTLTLVMSPTEDLGGRLLAVLPGLIAGVGLVTTTGAASLTERLLRRRDHAEQLSDENAQLLLRERSVALVLQRSLLPRDLPEIDGLDLAVRYEAGAANLEIGGDWYDAIPRHDDEVVLVVGDVSGRGLDAATTMASLRFAIRAYASEGDDPATILAKLNGLADFGRDGHFATVLCMSVGVRSRKVVIANAGHPAPILVSDTAEAIETHVGPPIGVVDAAVYRTVVVQAPPGATVLAFTDGLFERRGEAIDAGRARLLRAVETSHGSVDAVVAGTLAALATDGATDDTALLGIRWTD